MSRRIAASVLGLLLILSTAAADVRGGPGPAGRDADAATAEPDDNDAGPTGSDQWFTAQRLYPFTAPASLGDAYTAALAQTAPLRATAATAPWQPLGPSNVGGRITDLDKDTGEVKVNSEGQELRLHFPKTALQSFNKGDQVTVSLGIKAAGGTAGTRGRARGTPATPPGAAAWSRPSQCRSPSSARWA